jgi:hypothetical protein
MSTETRRLAAVVANAVRWAAEPDRSAATEPARATYMQQFRDAVTEAAASKGLQLTDDEIESRTARLRSAYFSKLRLDEIAAERARKREAEAEARRTAKDRALAALAAEIA